MAQFASDSFAGTEGQELAAYSGSWAKVTGLTGAFEIVSGLIRASSTTSPCYYHSGSPASADYSVSADIYKPSTSADVIGVTARTSTGANTMYRASINQNADAVNSQLQLFKFVAGVTTQLGSNTNVTHGTSTTKNIKLECVGSAIKVYWDGSGSASISVTDTAISAAGKAGVRAFSASSPTDTNVPQLDNFSADDIGGGGGFKSAWARGCNTVISSGARP